MSHDHDHPLHEGEEAPPPGVRAMAIVRWLLLAAMVLVASASVYAYAAPRLGGGAAAAPGAARYHCPMHPQITSDRPGECPICHMDLEPIPPERLAAPSAAATAKDAPPGTVPVTLSLDRVQAIGVRTAKVERVGAAGALRVTAAVEAPEQGRAEVHARAPGFVEAIQVAQTGVAVKAGAPLVSIYSPEIFQAQQELLAVGAWSGAGVGTAPPIEAARKKLELLGLGRAAVDRVVATGKPIRAITLSAPIGGYVIRKNVVLGSYVMPETALFEIADLDRVYVVASVYPHQLASIRRGDPATFRAPALGDRAIESKVDLIEPGVDLATRTARVRLQVDNKDLLLRPGQFGTVEFKGAGGAPALAVPLGAIVDTGRSVYVFVAEGEGRFSPRKVELGETIDGRAVVRSGLAEGESVVSGATFLVDAESRIEASFERRSP